MTDNQAKIGTKEDFTGTRNPSREVPSEEVNIASTSSQPIFGKPNHQQDERSKGMTNPQLNALERAKMKQEKRFKKDEEKRSKIEAQLTQGSAEPIMEKAKVAKVKVVKVKAVKAPKIPKPDVTIQCKECGAPRTIKHYEVFQVTRCVACQKAHTRQTKKDKRKNLIKTLRDNVACMEAYLKEANSFIAFTHYRAGWKKQ